MKNVFLIPVILLTAAYITGCSRGSAAKDKPPVPVLVARAVETNVPVLIDPPPVGHVMPVSSVTVHSQIGGLIKEVHFQEGQEVKKGDPLFTIDPRPSLAALDQAKAALERDAAQLEYATINYTREKKLYDQKLISEDELDTNRAALDALTGTVALDRAAITNATLNVEFCDIRSPIDGKTGALLAFQGNVVKAPDDTLLTINQIHPIHVAFAVPEQQLPQIKKEMAARTLKVTVTFQNLDAPPPQGELTFVDNSVDEATGQIQLRGTFPNTDGILSPGQFVQVWLTLSEITNALIVPSQAVQTGQNGDFVYVVKPDQTVAVRPVTTGMTRGAGMVVTKGLQAGETVVIDGQMRLTDSAKISVKSSTSPAATTHATAVP